ncbi:type I secretion system permease/ATPase [Marinibactrum halimedae]|uniref:Peptidase C39 n=1 Tax=Marinibactrum halimedae TaxID=1444977 RepID=A0AA37T6F2_9GAMM|nr:type I secretion system permease/ATPase [Marinibactrum halimedae]MCD9458837.1 type I secretion system permease/ATPase [Marinibactrum halimedae]GLS27689.1 peptidase C39 [Marinibactrum halimedae]
MKSVVRLNRPDQTNSSGQINPSDQTSPPNQNSGNDSSGNNNSGNDFPYEKTSVASLLGSILVVAMIHRLDVDFEQAEKRASSMISKQIKPCDKADKKMAKELACDLGLKVAFRQKALVELDHRQLPMVFRTKKGDWAVLAKLSEEQALVQRPGEKAPHILTHDKLADIWSGSVVFFKGRSAAKEKVKPFDVTWFIPEFLRYRHFAYEMLAASAFIEMLALLTPLFFQVVMDKVIVHQSMSTLDVLVTVLVIVAVLEVLLKCLRQYVATQTATRVDARLGGKLFSHMMELPIAYFKNRSVGLTVMRLRELDSIREFLTGAANTLIIDLSFTFIFFAVMYFYSPFLTLIVAASIPCYFLLSFLITAPLETRIQAMYRDGAINNAFLTETLSGVETVKALSLEPQLTRRWEKQTQNFVHSNFLVQRLMQLSGNLVTAIQKITTVLVLWFGARMVIDLELSIGQLIAFKMMADHVSQPITRLAELWRNYVQARVSIDRLGDVLDTPAERSEKQPALSNNIQGRITFNNVTFSYAPNLSPVFNNFNLDIPAGAMVAFVGPSGSGKSTITKLIQKLYLPSEGQVCVDGVDIATVDAVSLREQMSVVLQENYLFNRSVRENIAIADPAAPLGEVIESAKMAGAHDFILELSDGYDTVLAEGGASLSGGQRQRIAIARALMSNPSILILDEATSALDDHSQAIVQQGLETIRRGRTVIMVAHRLSTVRNCDRIFVLENGKIVESGNHDTLLAKKGAYSRLWSLQKGELGMQQHDHDFSQIRQQQQSPQRQTQTQTQTQQQRDRTAFTQGEVTFEGVSFKVDTVSS